MKYNTITRLNELLKNESIQEIEQEVNELKKAFKKSRDLSKKEQQKAFLDHYGKIERKFEYKNDMYDSKYSELINIYTERYIEFKEAQKVILANNLEAKKQVIEELKALIDNEDKIGSSFNKFNELREKWNGIGNVASDKFKELQSEYSFEVNRFYYNIDIYKALRSNDLKKNLEEKKAIIERVKALDSEASIKKVEYLVQQYQKEWDDVGPTFKEEWAKIRSEFWEAIREVYGKLNAHYESVRATHKSNFEAKQALIEELKQIVSKEPTKHKEWTTQTEKAIEVQAKWKKTGFVSHEMKEQVWSEFKGILDDFFNKKKAFYTNLKEGAKSNKEKKERLIARAEEYKVSTDWRTTTDKLKRLQNDWKQVGPAERKFEQKLWEQFRAACDFFFKAKKEFYDTLDDRQADNLKAKDALLKEMDAFKSTNDPEEDKAALSRFADRWDEIGHIPKNDISRIRSAHQKAMDKLYGKLSVEKGEADKMRFQMKAERLKSAPNAKELLFKERKQLQDRITRLEDEANKYENNLSFFRHSKNADSLRKDFEEKIEKAKEEASKLKAKLKMLA